jgi:hypothetical protein
VYWKAACYPCNGALGVDELWACNSEYAAQSYNAANVRDAVANVDVQPLIIIPSVAFLGRCYK